MATKERLAGIDALRGMAALAVVLFHYVGFISLVGIPVGSAGAALVAATRYGYLGVPIFFVLSGYVIALSAARYSFTPSVGARFVLRRLVRIAPPYWVMVGIIAGAVAVGKAAGYFPNTTLTLGQVVAHLLYVQELLEFPPLDVAYWTLCLEVQFYLVFAASAVAVGRLPSGFQMGWIMALTVGSAATDLAAAVPVAWFPRLWYQFGAGVIAYNAGRNRFARLTILLMLPALVGLGVYRGQASDFVVAAVVGWLLLAGHENRLLTHGPKALLGLGRISYSLYLVHGFVGIGLGIGFRSSVVQSEVTAWLAIVGGTATAIILATVFYGLCERHAIQWSRRVQVAPDRQNALAEIAVDAPNQPPQVPVQDSAKGVTEQEIGGSRSESP